MKTLARELRVLVWQGVLTNAWESQEEVADFLEIPRGTYVTYMSGKVRDETILKDVLAKTRNALKGLKKDIRFDPLTVQIQNAFLEGVRRGKWRNAYQCAKVCGITGRSVSRAIRDTGDVSSPTLQRVREKVLTAIRRKAGGEKGKVHKAPPISSNAKPSATGAALPAFLFNTQSAKNLLALVRDNGNLKDTDDLLVLLCEELARRFALIGKIDDLQERGRIIKKLSTAIDKLYLTIQGCLEVDESRSAKHLDRQQQLEN